MGLRRRFSGGRSHAGRRCWGIQSCSPESKPTRCRGSGSCRRRTIAFPTIRPARYTITWEGKGPFLVTGDGDNEFIIANGPGSRTFNAATGTNTLFLRIESMDQTDRLRNIRIWMPTYAPGKPTRANRFMQRSSIVRQAVRQPAVHGLESRERHDSTVNGPTYHSRSVRPVHHGTGVPDRATTSARSTRATADVWFNMPAHANDDYVTRFAQAPPSSGSMPRATPFPPRRRQSPAVPPVPADRRIYVEYANEAWNGLFEGSRLTRLNRQIAAGLESQGLNRGLYQAVGRRVLAATFDIWKGVFGAAGQPGPASAAWRRSRRVTASFRRCFSRSSSSTGCRNSTCFRRRSTWGSIRGLWRLDDQGQDSRLSLRVARGPPRSDDHHVPAGHPVPSRRPRRRRSVVEQFADQYGVELIAYEGGQSIDTGRITVPWYDD